MAQRLLSPTSTSSVDSAATADHAPLPRSRATASASPPISTPPTSLDDEASVLSEMTKLEHTTEILEEVPVAPAAPAAQLDAAAPQSAPDAAAPDGRRPARNSRKSVTTYNLQILAGTAVHTPTKYLEKHHKNVLHGSLEELAQAQTVTPAKKRTPRTKAESADPSDAVEEQLATEAAQAVRRRTSTRATDLRKEALRNLIGVGDAVANSISGGKSLVKNALRRSASDSNLRSTGSPALAGSSKRPRTAAGTDTPDEAPEPKEYLKPKTKTWLKQGLYVGQHREFDPRLSESQNRVKKRGRKGRENKALPLPMFAGDRLLSEDPRLVFRNFKLPFDTYNPLPRKVKVDNWTKLSRNRFIGDASALWKRDKQEDSSQCECEVEDGCGEACHNRIMAYECDFWNCRLSADTCRNRPFAELKRRSKGNRYDYGVEVMETDGRGYGVRAMRTFQPHQIIVEYAGEIITQSECERRMKQVYKKDKCYYLMSFDNKMIIDATRGTIARFVNHSCEPNCEMIKWTVGGEPRMALFAGKRGVMTGEELTYDYNFDPFSQKNIQECRCGTESCRGVLGPKPKKPVEEKSLASAIIAGTKRKLQSLLGTKRSASDSNQSSPKKRKILAGTAPSAKARNKSAQSRAAQERAEGEAAKHSQQIASREDRALKRSAVTVSKRSRTTTVRQTKLPSVKSTRLTSVTFQRKATKPGALKPVGKSSRVQAAIGRNTASGTTKVKGIPPTKRPSTPTSSSNAEDSESDSESDSPNITPAALRSASRKKLSHPQSASKLATESASQFDMDQDELSPATAVGTSRASHKNPVSTPRGMHKTGAGVKKTNHPAQSRSRSMRGRFLAKGLR